MKDNLVGVALIGAGRMARVHARNVGLAGGRLITVFDVISQAALSLARETGAIAAGDIKEAIDHPDVDAVLVVSSSNTHVDCILQAVEAGKPVMCEKPLAPSLAEAHRCVETLGTRAHNVFLGLNRRSANRLFGPSCGCVATSRQNR